MLFGLKTFFQTLTVLLLLGILSLSCGLSSFTRGILPDTETRDPMNAPTNPGGHKDSSIDILLFNGLGISTSDWQSLERLVLQLRLTYQLVNSAQLNQMSQSDLARFAVILIPGGHGDAITKGLNADTRVRVRKAVREDGVSFLGICAGAWVAVGSETMSLQSTGYGFSVVDGSHLSVWWPNGDSSKIATVTPVTFPNQTSRSLVWWGGPSTPEWTNGVVARYNNGKAAISQGWAKHGFVLLSGPHPEAPQGWRQEAGPDPDGLDYELAKQLILAAYDRQPLPTF